MESCECIKLTFQTLSGELTTVDLNTTGIFNGYNTFQFDIDGVTYFIWYNIFAPNEGWAIADSVNFDPNGWVAYFDEDQPCPNGSKPQWIGEFFTVLTIEVGSCQCPCIIINQIGATTPVETFQFTSPSGFYNGAPYWEYCVGSDGFILYLEVSDEGCRWVVGMEICGDQDFNSHLIFTQNFSEIDPCGCPYEREFFSRNENWNNYDVLSCTPPFECDPVEDRHQRKYDAIKLPVIFEEQNRGWKGCCDCDPMITLASPDPETWKNDITSAWIKMSDPTDVVFFKLKKNGIETTYTPTINAFINESDAYYTTINWIDVLNADGVGCYELSVEFNISGIIGSFVWGAYNLKPFTVENALETARIRVKLNLQQEIEGINFTGSNVEDTFRFHGFIGERQPNMEIDNLIYQNRGMKTVVRENLNTYKITTDPTGECITTKLTDLYLLSENEMWISDYNAHNHSYKYLDLPVIVKESPEIEYIDVLQRKAKIICEVADRNKNKRSFY